MKIVSLIRLTDRATGRTWTMEVMERPTGGGEWRLAVSCSDPAWTMWSNWKTSKHLIEQARDALLADLMSDGLFMEAPL